MVLENDFSQLRGCIPINSLRVPCAFVQCTQRHLHPAFSFPAVLQSGCWHCPSLFLTGWWEVACYCQGQAVTLTSQVPRSWHCLQKQGIHNFFKCTFVSALVPEPEDCSDAIYVLPRKAWQGWALKNQSQARVWATKFKPQLRPDWGQ